MSNAAAQVGIDSVPPRPLGYFTTLVWAVIANVIGSTVALGALHYWDLATFPGGLDVSESMKDARHVGVTTIAANIVQVGLIVGLTRWARWPAKDYLALTWPSRQDVTIALVSFIVLLPALDAMAYLAGQPIVPPFMTDLYRDAQNTGSLLLLWLAIVVVAPVAEEIVFRGFIFRSWVRAGRYAIIAIVVVSAVFAVIHLQYNRFGIFQVFLIGLMLTWTRWRSGSTLLPMALHIIANCYAMLQTVALVYWLS